MSIIFNKTCSNEEMLPKLYMYITHTFLCFSLVYVTERTPCPGGLIN